MAIEDFIFNERDKDRFRRFSQFAKPDGVTGGGGGGGGGSQNIQKFDTSKLPTGKNYVDPFYKTTGQTTDFYKPVIKPPSALEYVVGKKNDERTVRDESRSPFNFVTSKLRQRLGGLTDADTAKLEQERYNQEYRDNPLSILYTDNNEIVSLGRSKANLLYSIQESTKGNRPYKILGIDNDLNGQTEYDGRVNRLGQKQDVKKSLGDFRDRQEGFQGLISNGFMSTGPNSQSDMAIIFSYMKILDPDSVVRESEFELTEKKQKFIERVFGRPWRQVVTEQGEFLSPEGRKNIITSATQTYYDQRKLSDKKIEDITTLALRDGIDPKDLISDSSELLNTGFITKMKNSAANGYQGVDEILDYLVVAKDVGLGISKADQRLLLETVGFEPDVEDLEKINPITKEPYANVTEWFDVNFAPESTEEEDTNG